MKMTRLFLLLIFIASGCNKETNIPNLDYFDVNIPATYTEESIDLGRSFKFRCKHDEFVQWISKTPPLKDVIDQVPSLSGDESEILLLITSRLKEFSEVVYIDEIIEKAGVIYNFRITGKSYSSKFVDVTMEIQELGKKQK